MGKKPIKPTPPRDYLCEVFEYNQDTGELRWKKPTGPRAKVGSLAGHVNHDGYLRVSLNNNSYAASRIIWMMMCNEEPIEVDHINNDRSDNRWINLRNVTHAENQLNRKDTKKNGFLAKDNPMSKVRASERTRKWYANNKERSKERSRRWYANLTPEEKRIRNKRIVELRRKRRLAERMKEDKMS